MCIFRKRKKPLGQQINGRSFGQLSCPIKDSIKSIHYQLNDVDEKIEISLIFKKVVISAKTVLMISESFQRQKENSLLELKFNDTYIPNEVIILMNNQLRGMK